MSPHYKDDNMDRKRDKAITEKLRLKHRQVFTSARVK